MPGDNMRFHYSPRDAAMFCQAPEGKMFECHFPDLGLHGMWRRSDKIMINGMADVEKAKDFIFLKLVNGQVTMMTLFDKIYRPAIVFQFEEVEN